MIEGHCLCGGISFSANRVKPFFCCHCRQCRQVTGHFLVASQVALDDIKIMGIPRWYYDRPGIRYGFCPKCGSQLFWRNEANPYMSICLGAIDKGGEIPGRGHIYVGEKGNYYEITDDLPQYGAGSKAGCGHNE